MSLGGGARAPYPVPSSPAAAAVARANQRTGTGPELALRSELHRRGLRFRVDFPLEIGRRVRPDIVFTKVKVAVFVDGCFWHSCPIHGSISKSNVDYWAPKPERNRRRDAEVDEVLAAAGWSVLRAWEHEEVSAVAGAIEDELRQRRASVG